MKIEHLFWISLTSILIAVAAVGFILFLCYCRGLYSLVWRQPAHINQLELDIVDTRSRAEESTTVVPSHESFATSERANSDSGICSLSSI